MNLKDETFDYFLNYKKNLNIINSEEASSNYVLSK